MSAPERSRFAHGLSLTLACLAGVVAATREAVAVDVFRYDYQGAGAVCQPSLPEYSASLRSRPLGIANEGATTVFVTCTFQGDVAGGGRGARQLEVVAANIDVQTLGIVRCTLVDGFASGGVITAVYVDPRVGVFTHGGAQSITWSPADIAGNPQKIDRPGVLCSLPPNTVLQYFSKYYDENIGS